MENRTNIERLMNRGTEFRDNSLSLSHIDDYFISAIMIVTILNEGEINPAKREIRYLIDSSMRYLYVDQQLWRGTIKEKLVNMFMHPQSRLRNASHYTNKALPSVLIEQNNSEK